MAEVFRVGLKLDDVDWKKGLGDLQKDMEVSLASVNKVAKVGAAVALATVAAAAAASVLTIKRGIEEAIKLENAVNNLNFALAATGRYSESASKNLQDFAAELSTASRFGSDLVLESSAMIQNLAQLDQQGLKRATQAAADLAATFRIDLVKASELVGRAAQGDVSALRRFGVEVERSKDNTETFARVLTQLESRFGGKAQADLRTYSGRIAQIANEFGGVYEVIGNMVIQSPVVTAAMGEIVKAIRMVGERLKEFSDRGDPVRRLAQSFITIGRVLATQVLPPLEFLYNIMKAFGTVMATGVMVITTALVQSANLIQRYLIDPVMTFLAGVAGTIGEVFGSTIANDLADGLTKLRDENNSMWAELTKDTEKLTADLANISAKNLSKITDFSTSFSANDTISEFQRWLSEVEDPLRQGAADLNRSIKEEIDPSGWPSLADFAEGFKTASGTMREVMVGLGKQVRKVMESGLSNAFSAMGKALVEGENGMKAFGKAMLSVLGDIAIQFGAAFIGLGVGKTLLFDPTGPLLIAAGGALTVLGGAIKALAGGGGSNAPSAGAIASSPVGSQGGGIVVDGTPEYSEPTARERGNAVQVHVHGNVFNNRETALEIAEVLNDAWGSNAVAVGAPG